MMDKLDSPKNAPPSVTPRRTASEMSDSLTAGTTGGIDPSSCSSDLSDDSTLSSYPRTLPEESVPTLESPSSFLHVVSGPSQDRLYDNLDQQAYLELDASTIEGPSLDCKTIYDLEKFIQDTPKRYIHLSNTKEI